MMPVVPIEEGNGSNGYGQGPEIEHHELRPFVHAEEAGPSHGRFMSTMSITSCTISHSRFARVLVYCLVLVMCVPLVVGGAFTSIFVEDGNYNASVWAFFTACQAAGTMSIFILHLLYKLESYHDASTLEGIKVFSMLMSISSGISMGIYIILAFLHKQAFHLEGANYISAALFAGVSLSNSLMLYFTALWYQNAIRISERVAKYNNYSTLRPTSAVVN